MIESEQLFVLPTYTKKRKKRSETVNRERREKQQVKVALFGPRIYPDSRSYSNRSEEAIEKTRKYQVEYRRKHSENTYRFNQAYIERRQGKVKECTTCRKVLPFSFFSKRDVSNKKCTRKTVHKGVGIPPYSRTPEGVAIPYNLRSYCKECKSKSNKEYYARRKRETANAES